MILDKRTYRGNAYRWISILIGVVINVAMAYLTYRLDIPLYLDTIGTIGVAAIGGALPSLFVAMISNMIASSFNENAMYYAIINVLIALITAWFIRYHLFSKKRRVTEFILLIGAVSGVLGVAFQWILLGGPQFVDIKNTAILLFGKQGMSYFFGAMLLNVGLNIVDKLIAALVASIIVHFIPSSLRQYMWDSGWRQTPLTDEEIKQYRKKKDGNMLMRRMSFLMAGGTIALVAIMSWISINVYYNNAKQTDTENAYSAVKFVADVVDGDQVDSYIRNGVRAKGYTETKNLISNIRDNARSIKYLYVVKIDQRGCIWVFDLESEDLEAYHPGDVTEIEGYFEPYKEALLAGEEIEPIESNENWGWVLTVYYPIKNSEGQTVCYAGADVSLNYLSDYAKNFLLRALMIMSGFLVLILGVGLSISGYNLVYPISSMKSAAKGFIKSNGEQKLLDESVKKMNALDIRTNDEVEDLYRTICKMESDMVEQMRDIRYYAEATAKMQNGLIVTMADMVESRDSDTGAHVQKTSAYARIIMDGLRKKGYYLDKLTPKYMSDVEMSAPLHDVGKINIPDAVLNKPGKLTDEEFAIMKTHTTAGKKILENAISTVEGENYLKEARNMAAYHHERWDGKGYPEGLSGEVIPLSARIMAVADVFDALSSPRIYKPAFPLEKSLAIINEGSGTQFDPKCVEVFMDNLTEVKRVLRKYNNYEE